MPRDETASAPSAESLVDTGVEGAPGVETPLAGTTAPDAPDPATLARERDEYYDLLLRKTAEFDNYRKRTERERREQAERAALDLITDLLPLIDNLERALAAPADDAGGDSYRRGVELIHRQLLDLLGRRGVVVIDPTGAPFDPHWHEAVVREAAPDGRDGDVLQVFSKGYRIGERLLRPAMVKVASA